MMVQKQFYKAFGLLYEEMKNALNLYQKEAFYRWLNGETTLNEEKFEVVHQPKSRRRKKRYIEETDAIWDTAKKEAEHLRGKQLQHFRTVYRLISMLACCSLLLILLLTVSWLPPYAAPEKRVERASTITARP